jgi:hypothetical protein
VDLTTLNPLAEDSINRHPRIRQTEIVLPKSGTVNSYVKTQFRRLDDTAPTAVAPKCSAFYGNTMAVRHRSIPSVPGGKANISRLPPQFGRGPKLDELDSKLLKFCERFANMSGGASPYG